MKQNQYLSFEPERKEHIVTQLVRLLEQRKEIIFSMLHGSFVSNDRFRDIDVAVWLAEDKMYPKDTLDYELSLSVEISYELNLPVDVKVLNFAPLGFQYYAVSGRLLTCTDDDFRVDTIVSIWNRYFDFLPKSKEFLLEMI
ncbi:MAG: nucleotidyltransferase domain-containing protein [Deltaproteobacteria bacterium]|nr:nucleotidyltransferase domain-containing protein [Deltaproteobacteria bacterium]